MLVPVAVMGALVIFNVRGVHKEGWQHRYVNVDSLNLLDRFHARPGPIAPRELHQWRHGWPFAFLWRQRNVRVTDETEYWSYGIEDHRGTWSRWLRPDTAVYVAPGGFCQTTLLVDIAVGVLIVVSTGYTMERSRARRRQFSLRTLLLLPVIVAVMFAAAWIDPTLRDFPDCILAWPLLGVVWFGVGCTVCAGGLLVVRALGRLRVRGRAKTPQEAGHPPNATAARCPPAANARGKPRR